MSYKQFLATDFENPHVEWVNGKVVPMSPINEEHQFLGGLLVTLLRTYAEERKLGVVLSDPFQMKTGPDLPGRSPDILFVSNAHKRRLKRMYLDGPADLAVEIISPGSRRRDRQEKFREYDKGGVREYWLIDPARKLAEFYLEDKGGTYQHALLDSAGRFHSVALPGVWLKPGWLWAKPLPTALSIMREWELI
ncbi:MAG TPA: Uma2 family endonuclease [Tepidisphaeraceae bacterium]|nr:Uma2 family endonuclease [Tepidisphaeraceae bacterium]